MPIKNRITDITGVNQGGTAVASLEVGRRYHNLSFLVTVNGAPVAAEDVVDRVRLKVNERTIWDLSCARLQSRKNVGREMVGNLDYTNRVFIDFANPNRADKEDELFTAWDLFGERSFTAELQLKELANPADVIRIEGSQVFDYGYWPTKDGSRAKNIIRLQEVSENLINGAVDITKLPIANPIQRIFFDTTANISLVEVDADGRRVFEAVAREAEAQMLDYGETWTNDFAYIYAPDASERILDHLAVSRTLNVRVTADASQPVVCLVESLSNGFN